MRSGRSSVLLVGVLILSLLVVGCTVLQDTMTDKQANYPTKPINLIVAFSAGGGADLQARALKKVAERHLGQSLIVRNKPGGSGSVGWNELIDSELDGYTIGVVDSGALLMPLYGKKKYHYPTALEPLAQFSESSCVLVVNAEQPWQTLADLIAASKEQKSPFKFGHAGVGSTAHIIGAALAKEAGIKLEQVPFYSGGEALRALLAGSVQVAIANPAAVKEQIQAGKVRALGVAGDQRSSDPELAQIPTLKEQGVAVSLTTWRCIVTPKPLPTEVKAKLEAALAAMIADPEFKENMEELGLEVNYLNSADALKKWQAEIKKLEKMVDETGILEQIKAQQQS